MIRVLALAGVAVFLAACAAPEGPVNQLERANVLPLALDRDFEFRKVQLSLLDTTRPMVQTQSEAARFERARATWGAIDSIELRQRDGQYFHFFWRARREADITVRLEYRQAGLANFVKAKEIYYPATRGSRKSTFEVIGDEFLENGRVTSWRALLIVEGRIVAFRQSFMWR